MKINYKSPLALSLMPLSLYVPLVTAAISEPGDGTIVITGQAATNTNTPEAVLRLALEDFCPKIEAIVAGEGSISSDTQQLLEVCTAINAATDIAETEQAYRQLSARSFTTITTLLTHGLTTVSLGDIGSRLAALRRAARLLNTAALEPNLNPTDLQHAFASLPLGYAGGGASADEQGGLYDNRLSGFISADHINSEQTETDTLAGFEAKNNGLTLGLDYRFTQNAFAGVATRLLNGKAELNSDAGSLDSKDTNLTFYGTYFPTQSFYVDGSLQISHGNYDLTRKIDFTVNSVTQLETASGSTDGSQFGASIGAGYEHFFSEPAITAEVTGSLKYNRAKLAAYEETGANGLDLNIDEITLTTEMLTIGAQVSKAINYSGGVIQPQFNVAWKHDLKTEGQDISASFTADPFETRFVFATDEHDADYFELALGVSHVSPGGWSSFAQYTSVIGYENYKQSMLALGVRKEF